MGTVPSLGRSRPSKRRTTVTAYRGADRRGLVAEGRPPGVSFSVACVVIGLVFAVSVLTTRGAGPLPSNLDIVAKEVGAIAVTLALVLGALGVVRWRLLGVSSGLALTASAVIYGVGTLGVSSLVGDELLTASTFIWIPHVSRLVAPSVLLIALIVPDVDTGVRPRRLMGAVLVLGLTLLVAVQAWPAGGRAIVGTGPRPAGAAESLWTAFPTLVVLVVGLGAIWAGHRRRHHVTAWFGLAFVAAGLSEVLVHGVAVPSAERLLSAAVLVAVGLAYAVYGLVRDLCRSYRLQGGRLLDSVTATRTTEARLNADHAAQKERAHEARNALAAIEAATSLLQRHHEQMTSELRTELSDGISDEVRRLQHLVCSPAPSELGRFRLSEAIAALVTCARSQGTEVAVDVPDDLIAYGRPAETAQVLQNLIQNAQRYGGSWLTLTASIESSHVVIRVQDRGPGIAVEEAGPIFERGVRGAAAEGTVGDGLGLSVSRRLMRDQGGELVLEPPSAVGGASFAVTLPGFREAPVEELLEEGDDRGQATNTVGQLFVVPSASDRPRSPGVIEDDRGVREPLAQ
jgi:signal transduction histidine kinase